MSVIDAAAAASDDSDEREGQTSKTQGKLGGGPSRKMLTAGSPENWHSDSRNLAAALRGRGDWGRNQRARGIEDGRDGRTDGRADRVEMILGHQWQISGCSRGRREEEREGDGRERNLDLSMTIKDTSAKGCMRRYVLMLFLFPVFRTGTHSVLFSNFT